MHWNHQENISLTPIHGKSVSTKLIPGDKKVGDCCFTTFITMKELLFCQVKYSNGICLYYSLVLSWIPHPSPTKCPSTCVRWRFQISLCCYTYRFAIQVHFSTVSQLCLTLCESMDCSLTDSSIHGIFQARILECVAISFSRESSWPRDRIWVSYIAGRPFYGLNHQGSPPDLPPRYSEVFYTHCIAPKPTCCLRLWSGWHHASDIRQQGYRPCLKGRYKLLSLVKTF